MNIFRLIFKRMRAIVQRVNEASVEIDGSIVNAIGKGLLVFLGITIDDNDSDIQYLVMKIAQLRIFEDEGHKMNRSVMDVSGEILLISQFTLYASTKKGNRPSFLLAARPKISMPLYESFILELSSMIQGKLKTGVFGADMKIRLINDGPVTIIIDSKEKE